MFWEYSQVQHFFRGVRYGQTGGWSRHGIVIVQETGSAEPGTPCNSRCNTWTLFFRRQVAFDVLRTQDGMALAERRDIGSPRLRRETCMAVRIGTFNIENLLTRFDFTGFRNQLRGDRVLRLYQIATAADYQRLEEARIISLTDDTRQLTGLAIAAADADILCLQEVESLEVEVIGRLVEHQQVRFPGEFPGQQQPRTLAARQRPDRRLGQ